MDDQAVQALVGGADHDGDHLPVGGTAMLAGLTELAVARKPADGIVPAHGAAADCGARRARAAQRDGRQTEFGGRRPYCFQAADRSASGRWEMWMDRIQARAVRGLDDGA